MISFWSYLAVFGLAAVPIIEVKGAIPLGMSLGIPQLQCFIIAIFGAMIFTPLIILLTRRVLTWCMNSKINVLRRFGHWQHERLLRKGGKIEKYREWFLFIFVAIPLPTTRCWTGSMIAGLFEIPLKKALPIIFFGNVVASALVWLIWGFATSI